MKNKHTSEILLQKRERLISSFLKEKEPDFLKRNARILDEYFIENYEKSLIETGTDRGKNPCAIIALGGYGREEQCIHSDVDLLFLFEKNVPAEAENLVRNIVYPLWDIGLDVGHATRSLKENLSLADKDVEVLTSTMDARFICGMSFLYSALMKQLKNKLILNRSDEIITSLIEKNNGRHQRFGDSTYLLEPNLKEGRGGLRDYHTMLWIARIKFNLKSPRDLEYYGCLSHDEFLSLTEALLFVWNTRNRLHLITGRKCDQLYLEYQIELANSLKLKKINGQEPVERFLGKLHGKMEFIKQQLLMFLNEQWYAKKQKNKIISLKRTRVNGLELSGDMLNFTSSENILNSPFLLIKIFEESAHLKVPLSAEAKRLVKEFSYLVDDKFRNSNSFVRSFENILITPAPMFNVLNEMLNTGLLVRFIPEIKGIINRIQYDEYHLYPADKHSLRTIQTIKKFGTSEDATKDRLCGDLYKELSNKKLLLWAAILHDIGKAEPIKGHAQRGARVAGAILAKKGFKSRDIEVVSFLIEEHLFLIKTATRRDIDDEETALFCARRVKKAERLKMLYLLTVADSISTGPKAWNDWISTLLKDLFLKILSILEKGELATGRAVKLVEKKRKKVLRSGFGLQDKQDMETLFNIISPRYFLYVPARDIPEHIRLYKSLKNRNFVWRVTKASISSTRIVTICAKNSPGLFSKIAGTFTLNGIDILGSRVYTWKNNIALDIFEVKPPPDQIFETERWARAKENLESALSGKLDLAAALEKMMSAYQSFKPKIPVQMQHTGQPERSRRIIVDNESSGFFTIIEVFAYDFPGLLFSITDALFKCGLDVWIAKIATRIDQVVDIFYVRDFDGQKVDSPDRVAAIKETIAKVIPEYR